MNFLYLIKADKDFKCGGFCGKMVEKDQLYCFPGKKRYCLDCGDIVVSGKIIYFKAMISSLKGYEKVKAEIDQAKGGKI